MYVWIKGGRMPKGRYWTDAELEFLSDYAGLLNHQELSKKLNRSIDSIKLKQTRCGIKFKDSFYSYTTLSKELGRSRSRIRVWHKRGWIKGRWANWTTYYGHAPMIFLEPDIVNFLKAHFHLFNYRRIPNKYFSNVVKECVAP